MKDLIERYLAERRIDEALSRVFTKNSDSIGKQILDRIPSAQAEIIRCKDCKHWREGTSFSYCDKLHGMGVLDALDYMTAEDDYCSMAERREK